MQKQIVCLHDVRVPPNSSKEMPVSYTLSDGIRGVATVEARERNSATPFFRQSVLLELPPNRALMIMIQDTLHQTRRYSLIPRAGISTERRILDQELHKISKALSRKDVSRAVWFSAEPELRRLLGRAQKLVWMQQYHDYLRGKGFAVGVVPSLRKVIRDEPFLDNPTGRVLLEGARGETEGFHLLIIPLMGTMDNVRFVTTDLFGPTGATIPAESIRIFWEGFVESRPGRYPVEGIFVYGDALIPLDRAPAEISEDVLHQPYWVSVAIPRGIPAGVYKGKVTITAENAEPAEVALRLRVYDFDLPMQPALKTSLWMNPDRVKQWYGWEDIPADVLKRQIAFLLEHRLNPCWFGPLGDEKDMEWQLSHGLNGVMLGVAAEWPLPEEMECQIQRWYDFLKRRDLLDLAFIYAQDEPSPQDYPKVRQTMEQVAKRWPGVKRMCTAFPPVQELEGAVDIWVVGPNLFNERAVAERQDAGDDLWIYLSASVRRPYAMQLYLDYTALEHRLIGWYCWKYGAKGFLYWGINEWESNRIPWSGLSQIDDAIRVGKRWPEVPWNAWTYLDCNGEAQYVYPGPDGEFWSSVRLEILRDSFEDYDYFAILGRAISRLQAANLPGTEALRHRAERLLDFGPPIISGLTLATDNPDDLSTRRVAIAECIEEISQRLRQEDQ